MPTTRVTKHTYDFRGRRIATDGEVDFYEKTTYDNLDRVTKSERYDTTSSGNLVARSETKYDDRGRVYESVRYGVDPSTGTVGNSLTDKTWYDASGHVIKQQPAGSKLFTKSTYDGLGRQTKQYRGFDMDETSYSDAGDVTGDTILEQTELSYDAASNVIETVQRQRYHNATGTGSLGGPSTTQPKARVSYHANWPDALGRSVAMANYGTNGGSALSRPSTIPDPSDDVLVMSMVYDSAGNMATQTNPGGVTTCLEYDAAGRQVKQIMNCVNASSSSSSSSSSSGPPATDDINVTVETAYNADGNVESITARNSVTGDQTTQYVYGTTLTDSEVASTLLKRHEIYPDSADDDDVILFEYNRQGQITKTTDQNGTVHQFDFDALGRQIHDRVTTLGNGVDGGVRRISTTYEVRGMRETITSYNGETVGSGTVVNDVQFAYNDFGQVMADYQAHSGAVNTGTTPKVQYGYADGSANIVRPTTVTYPNGRTITYDYGTSDSMADAASRIASIVDDDMSSTHLADYAYLGISTFVEADYTQPDLKWTMVGTTGGNDPDTGDIYRGFDRFTRIKDNYWYDYGGMADVDRIKHGYDRNGSRLWRENAVAAANGKSFDELYDYDLIGRLKTMDRGELNALKDAITNKQFAQDWALDATGNWRNFREDDDGDDSWDLDQQRTSNKVNEITDIAESLGPSWVTPDYHKAGNMTTIPKPADPTASFAGTYDAWNRLVQITEGATTVARYEYDGAKRRIVKRTYSGGVLDETRYSFFTEPSRWQVVEERVDSSSDPERQFVWGLRYIDDIVQRDRDTTDDGTLDDRLYSMQDANWNVTAVADTGGSVAERYSYDAYGTTAALTPAFASRGDSDYDWERRFAAYWYDSEVQFYQVRSRVYYATLGWLQRDPMEYSDALSLYEYVSSKPLGKVDPRGLLGIGTIVNACDRAYRACFTSCYAGFDLEFGGTIFEACVNTCRRSRRLCLPQSICEGLVATCPGCTAVRCERDLLRLFDAINEVSWTVYLGPNTCARWAFDYEKKLTQKLGGLLLGPCIRQVRIVTWETGGVVSPRHAGIEITLCDGTVYFLDNGALGGSDHIFSGEEVPNYWR